MLDVRLSDKLKYSIYWINLNKCIKLCNIIYQELPEVPDRLLKVYSIIYTMRIYCISPAYISKYIEGMSIDSKRQISRYIIVCDRVFQGN